jgi:hypothetical protein
MDGIIDVLRTHAMLDCLPRSLRRNSRGRVACDVSWELPPDTGASDAPVSCSDRDFLSEVSKPRAARDERGGRVCQVAQLAVKGGKPAAGEGFYYDDFSAERSELCRGEDPSRIAFSAGAKPPAGVRVFIDCDP